MPEPIFTEGLSAITHAGVDEALQMNRFHFLLVIERLLAPPPARLWTWERASIPLALFLGLLFSVVTADFHDALGLRKEVWEAIAVILIACTGFGTAAMALGAAVTRGAPARPTAEGVLDEVLAEMERGRNALASQRAAERTTSARRRPGARPANEPER